MSRPVWVPDGDVSHCGACKGLFEFLIQRKHHCRNCGQIFCDNCSKNRSLLPESFRYDAPKRVCDACFKVLESNPETRFHQAGGHASGVVRTHPGFVTKHTNSSELRFFQTLLKNSTTTIPSDIQEAFFPKVESIVDQLLSKTVTMEDLTFGYNKPCVMDIKMGNSTVGEDANFLKEIIMNNKDKQTTSFDLGCRIVAYRTYDIAKQEFKQLIKADANKISDIKQFQSAYLDFFTTGVSRSSTDSTSTTTETNNNTIFRLDVIDTCLTKLLKLHEWMSVQTHYKFVASSLLFVYDADSTTKLKADVTMIDFAHVFEINNDTPDLGYVKGLETLITTMKLILHEHGHNYNDNINNNNDNNNNNS